MNKVLGTLIVLASFLSSTQGIAESIKTKSVIRHCQSRGEHYGRMVYIDLLQTDENKYVAILSEAKNTSSQRYQFLQVDNIHRDAYTRGVMQSFYDVKGEKGKGFSFVPDSEDSSENSQLTWVTYYYDNELLSGTFSCKHMD